MSSLPIPTKYKYKVSNKVTVWAACSDGAVRQYSYSEGQAGERLELTRQGQEVSSHCLQVVRLLGASLVTTNTGGEITVWSRTDPHSDKSYLYIFNFIELYYYYSYQ